MHIFLESPVLLTIAVFLARIVDVSLGTVRSILVFRSYRVWAALIGFVEILIWLSAAAGVLRDLSAWYLAVAYAGGFGTGVYVGVWLEAKLAMGMEMVRAISFNPAIPLAKRLREHHYSVTELDGHDDDGAPVEVLLVVEERRRLPHLLQLIEQTDPDTIYTISDIKQHRSTGRERLRQQRLKSK